MSDEWVSYKCLQDEVTNSLNFVHPDTGSDTQRIGNRWTVKQGLPRTMTFKELFESNLQEFKNICVVGITRRSSLWKHSKVYRRT